AARAPRPPRRGRGVSRPVVSLYCRVGDLRAAAAAPDVTPFMKVTTPKPLNAADRASLEKQAEKYGVPAARRHIFLCCDQTKPKCCEKDRGLEAWAFLKRRLKEMGLSEQGGILR